MEERKDATISGSGFNDIIPNDGDLDGQEVGAFNQNPRSRYKGL